MLRPTLLHTNFAHELYTNTYISYFHDNDNANDDGNYNHTHFSGKNLPGNVVIFV